jgi:hypothetical protein
VSAPRAEHLRPARCADVADACRACGQGDRLLDRPRGPHSGEVIARSGLRNDLASRHGLFRLTRIAGDPAGRCRGLAAVTTKRIGAGRRRGGLSVRIRSGDTRRSRCRGARRPTSPACGYPMEARCPLRERTRPIRQQSQREDQADPQVVSHRLAPTVCGSPEARCSSVPNQQPKSVRFIMPTAGPNTRSNRSRRVLFASRKAMACLHFGVSVSEHTRNCLSAKPE